MIIATRITLGLGLVAGVACTSVLAWRGLVRHEVPPSAAQVVPSEEEEMYEEHNLDPEAPEPRTTIGVVGLDWMPSGYVREVSEDRTRDLAQFLDAWTANDFAPAPRIEYARGVVFAHSTEDRGDDGPTPRSASAESSHVCGTQATWMRAALRATLVHRELVCENNVCSYDGMEYAPHGYLVFRAVTIDGEPTWALDAWVEVYDAGLSSEVATKNVADVARAMKRLREATCAGEPAGAY
jgi:hypothetical protein